MSAPLYDTPVRQRLALPQTELFQYAAEIVEVLRREGYDAFLVGGSIRDSVMGKTAKDCDITTNARPDHVQALFPRTVPIGIEFGTVMVLQDDLPFEVTTFRADGRYEDGRRPESVSFSEHVTDDLERRDLTINGLIYAPESEEVLDYTGGLADIERRVIRTIGSPLERFGEDRLRMLRAVRFAARLNFQLDSDTFEAIRSMAPNIQDVSIERIQQEFQKMVQGAHPTRGLQLLHETRLLPEILPELPRHETALHRLLHYEALEAPNETLALALLLVDAGDSQAEHMLRRLRFPNETISQVGTLLKQYHTLEQYIELPMAARKRFLRQPLMADILTLSTILQYHDQVPCEAVRAIQADLSQWDQAALSPTRLLDGNQLKLWGYRPGPQFKEILDAAEDEQLEGNLNALDEVQRWLASHYPQEDNT